MISASVTRGQAGESWRQVGADAVIEAPVRAVIPPALQRRIASMPGVAATATGVVSDATLPAGQELTAVFVSPARYAAVTDQAPGVQFPVAALSGNAARGGCWWKCKPVAVRGRCCTGPNRLPACKDRSASS